MSSLRTALAAGGRTDRHSQAGVQWRVVQVTVSGSTGSLPQHVHHSGLERPGGSGSQPRRFPTVAAQCCPGPLSTHEMLCMRSPHWTPELCPDISKGSQSQRSANYSSQRKYSGMLIFHKMTCHYTHLESALGWPRQENLQFQPGLNNKTVSQNPNQQQRGENKM